MTTRSQISLALVFTLCAFPASATAEQYWIAYERNDFPENEGWTRRMADEHGYGQGGAERRIVDGVLILDSLRHSLIWDHYRLDRPIDPDPGDLFVAEWRVKVTQSVNGEDAGLAFARDEFGTLTFLYTADEIISHREQWHYPITPYAFHTYRIESSDMIHYSLWIDGEYARDGEWELNSVNQSFAFFGDIHRGGVATSYSEWDYFRFGTVPEASALWLLAAGLGACALRKVRSTVRRVVILPVLACTLAGSARAEPYWIAYEGNDFPENEGWTRSFGDEHGPGQGGAERRIVDGVLILDSLRHHQIYDNYRLERPMDPGPGELFAAEWRLRITENLNHQDAGLVFARDDFGTLAFLYTAYEIISSREHWSLPITPYVFHTYRIESSDMIHYSLWIDGDYARDGEWDLTSWNQSFAGFGDLGRGGGAGSYTEWDYFRFGALPEPSAMTLLTAVVLVNIRRRFRNAKRDSNCIGLARHDHHGER
jgi:hypothetical protein